MVRHRSRTATVALTLCAVAVLAAVAGWLALRSEVTVPPMVRAYLLQEVVGQSGYHPTALFDWVQLNGESLDTWENARDIVPNYKPTTEFYLIELRGRFGPFSTSPPYPTSTQTSTETGTVDFIAVATHSSGVPTEKNVSLPSNAWLLHTFISLSSLGQGNEGTVPKSPKLAKGRLPDLVGLNYYYNPLGLRRLAPSIRYQQIARYNPYLPLFTIVAQTPKSGQHRLRTVVTITVNA